MNTAKDISDEERQFLSTLSAQETGLAYITSEREREFLRRLYELGYVDDIIDMGEGACGARISQAGRDRLIAT